MHLLLADPLLGRRPPKILAFQQPSLQLEISIRHSSGQRVEAEMMHMASERFHLKKASLFLALFPSCQLECEWNTISVHKVEDFEDPGSQMGSTSPQTNCKPPIWTSLTVENASLCCLNHCYYFLFSATHS